MYTHWAVFRHEEEVGQKGERIIYVVPPSKDNDVLTNAYISWWKESRHSVHIPIGAALAHIYFVIIHQFDDGNAWMPHILYDTYLAT